MSKRVKIAMKLRERILAYLQRKMEEWVNQPGDIPCEIYEDIVKALDNTCNVCKHFGSKKCPPVIKCLGKQDRPYFEPKEAKVGFWKRIFKKR